MGLKPTFLTVLIFMGSLFIWGKSPVIIQLNGNLAGLGTPVPMGVDLICNKA